MLRPDAPDFADYQPDEPWRLAATGIPRELFYALDWVDPDRWDLWLYENYPAHRQAMRDTLAGWVDAVAEFARRRGIPAVLGEGVVGYTPSSPASRRTPSARTSPSSSSTAASPPVSTASS